MPTTRIVLLVRVALGLALLALVALLTFYGRVTSLVLVVVLVVCAVVGGVAAIALAATRRTRAPLAAAASAFGMAGSVLYLRLLDAPAAIPIAGVAVLFLSSSGAALTLVLLRSPSGTDDRAPAH